MLREGGVFHSERDGHVTGGVCSILRGTGMVTQHSRGPWHTAPGGFGGGGGGGRWSTWSSCFTFTEARQTISGCGDLQCDLQSARYAGQ